MQYKRKKDLKEYEKYEEKEFVEFWKEKMKQLDDDEKNELKEIKDRNKHLANYHKLQMEVKKRKANEEFVIDQESSYKTKMMLNNEQDDFLNYAEGWIKEFHDQGKDITPLILDLKAYKKKLFYG